MRGLVGLGGLVGGPLEEGGFSDWSDGSDWSEIFLRVGLGGGPLKRPSLRKKKNPAPLGGGAGLIF